DYNIYDISDFAFTINSTVLLLAPNGGESWSGCGTYTVTWSKSPCLGSWTIYYSTDNGVNWNSLTSQSDNLQPTQSFVWQQVSNYINSTQMLFRVANTNSPTVYVDQSDATFTMSPSNDITVL